MFILALVVGICGLGTGAMLGLAQSTKRREDAFKGK